MIVGLADMRDNQMLERSPRQSIEKVARLLITQMPEAPTDPSLQTKRIGSALQRL